MKEIGFDVPDRKGFDSRWKTFKVKLLQFQFHRNFSFNPDLLRSYLFGRWIKNKSRDRLLSQTFETKNGTLSYFPREHFSSSRLSPARQETALRWSNYTDCLVILHRLQNIQKGTTPLFRNINVLAYGPPLSCRARDMREDDNKVFMRDNNDFQNRYKSRKTSCVKQFGMDDISKIVWCSGLKG